MLKDSGFVDRLKQDIRNQYQQKYGNVYVDIDAIQPVENQSARVEVTISDIHGFITRHYGKAYYEGTELHLRTRAI